MMQQHTSAVSLVKCMSAYGTALGLSERYEDSNNLSVKHLLSIYEQAILKIWSGSPMF